MSQASKEMSFFFIRSYIKMDLVLKVLFCDLFNPTEFFYMLLRN